MDWIALCDCVCCFFSAGRVDFLYKDKADPEEYLLGKRVDTNFERQNIPEKSE